MDMWCVENSLCGPRKRVLIEIKTRVSSSVIAGVIAQTITHGKQFWTATMETVGKSIPTPKYRFVLWIFAEHLNGMKL